MITQTTKCNYTIKHFLHISFRSKGKVLPLQKFVKFRLMYRIQGCVYKPKVCIALAYIKDISLITEVEFALRSVVGDYSIYKLDKHKKVKG